MVPDRHIPAADKLLNYGRTAHTNHLAALLADRQQVARSDPEVKW